MDATGVNSSLVQLESIPDNYHLPAEMMSRILGFLPQKDLISCREMCRYWRDVIDLHCPMQDLISLKADDKFLDRKLQLRIRYCQLSYFFKRSPKILLSYPQAMEIFILSCESNHDELYAKHAYGILRQIKPFVQCLVISCYYFVRNDIFSPPYLFPNITSLHIGCSQDSYETHNCQSMFGNFDIVFSHQFPLLESLTVCLKYENKKLMREGLANFLTFLEKHSQTLKVLSVKVCQRLNDDEGDGLTDFPETDISKEVELLVFNSKLQIEYLSLHYPLNYLAWAPIIKTQRKLIDLSVGFPCECSGPGSVPFHSIVPGIRSSISTLRIVDLYNISSVRYDGVSWIPLDASVFINAVNLTDFKLRRNFSLMDHDRTPRVEGAEIINLDKVNSTSLKVLEISNFVCNSSELQTLIDNASILETLHLVDVLAPPTSHRFAHTGVHGGIIQSFLQKESKRSIEVDHSINISDEAENDKLEAVRLLYPEGFRSNDSFIRNFSEQFVLFNTDLH